MAAKKVGPIPTATIIGSRIRLVIHSSLITLFSKY
jgi:hypothetical protein